MIAMKVIWDAASTSNGANGANGSDVLLHKHPRAADEEEEGVEVQAYRTKKVKVSEA